MNVPFLTLNQLMKKTVSHEKIVRKCQGDICYNGTTTLSIKTFGIKTFSIKTFSIKTFSIKTFSIKTFSITTFSILVNKMRHSA